jgi:hypothetical protein
MVKITGSNGDILLSNFMRYHDNISFNVSASNATFSGHYGFNSLLDTFNLKIIELGLFLENKQDSFILNDYDSDQYIKILKKDNLGNYKVSTLVGGSHNENYVTLCFEADLISIHYFLNDLKEVKY